MAGALITKAVCCFVGRNRIWAAFMVMAFSVLLAACESEESVVIYASVDQHYAEPILRAFEKQSGIKVLAVYDVEAAKTTGLVNRLIAERRKPRADVFWNGEAVQTILLKNNAALARYRPPSADEIPTQFRDPDDFWTGFGGRARIIIVNTERLAVRDRPRSIFAFTQGSLQNQKRAVAHPLFGTTATHAAALYAALGPDRAAGFFKRLRDRGTKVLDGNSTVRDQVVSGKLDFGLTDTDDACAAIVRGQPVAIVMPDQEDGGLGTLVIPNTVALVAGSPNPKHGMALIDFLLSKKVTKRLVEAGWIHVPIREVDARPPCALPRPIRTMSVSMNEVYRYRERARLDLTEMFVR